MGKRLSDDAIRHYHEQGYLLPEEPVFDAATFADLQADYERLARRWSDEYGGRAEDMDLPHFWAPELFRYLLDERLLDLVEDLIGPDIALFSSHFIAKPPGTGRRVPWHEDSAYWQKRIDPMEVVTLWLAIDPTDAENGCMQVVPGTHVGGYSQYHQVEGPSVFGTEIDQDQFDASQAVDCILDENQCSFHHAKLIHGSAPNTSPRRRCGYTMRYVPTTSRLDTSNYARDVKLFLARGKDRAGNRYADPRTLELV